MMIPGLDKGDWLPFYLFVSDESLLVQRELKRCKNEIVAENLRAFNLDVLDGKGLEAQKVVSIARTLPMMGPKRLIVIENLEKMKSKELLTLLGYLKTANPETVICATSQKIDKRIKFSLKLKNKGGCLNLAALKMSVLGSPKKCLRRI